MISLFRNIKCPLPIEQIDVYDFLERIKNPENSTLELILKAREHKANGQSTMYDFIKTKISCVTLNFTFEDKKLNSNIKQATGFIYLDVDDETDIDLEHPLIFASWLSLSEAGRGVLVKVNGLSNENFKESYESISKQLNIRTDPNAAKATQYTILSYDEHPYLNEDSLTYEAVTKIQNTPITTVSKRGKRKDADGLGEREKLHFDNIHNIDFDGKDYLVFPEKKEMIAKAFIPKRIGEGERNSKLSVISLQLRALNPNISKKRFTKLIQSINLNHCKPPMLEREVKIIISKILSQEDLELLYNTPRRVIFNPACSLNRREKMKIVNKITGAQRSSKTLEQLKEVVIDWDAFTLGKVTQKKLAKVSNRNIKTVEKYYKNLKELIQSVNQSILLNPSKSLSPA